MSRDTTPLQTERPIIGMSERDVIVETEQLLAEAGLDERRVILYIMRRFIRLGQHCYGELDLKTDKRDGHTELNEELADGLVYIAFMALRGKLTRRPTPRLLEELWDAALGWSAQGARTHWSTAASLRLYDKVQQIKDRLRPSS